MFAALEHSRDSGLGRQACGQSSRLRLLFALILFLFPGVALRPQPPGEPDPSAGWASPEVAPEAQASSQPAACEGGYTTTACSLENQRFVRSLDIFGILILGLFSALIVPIAGGFVKTRGMSWWRANPWTRWLYPTLIGFFIAVLLFLVLPLLVYRGVLPPVFQAPLFWFREDFFSSCAPCSAEVSNYPPLFGIFGHLGMAPMGLAIDHPFSLLLALLLSFFLFSLLALIIHLALRQYLGFRRLCQE